MQFSGNFNKIVSWRPPPPGLAPPPRGNPASATKNVELFNFGFTDTSLFVCTVSEERNAWSSTIPCAAWLQLSHRQALKLRYLSGVSFLKFITHPITSTITIRGKNPSQLHTSTLNIPSKYWSEVLTHECKQLLVVAKQLLLLHSVVAQLLPDDASATQQNLETGRFLLMVFINGTNTGRVQLFEVIRQQGFALK